MRQRDAAACRPDPEVPAYLRDLAARAATGDAVLADPLRPVPAGFAPRRSAVLVLLAGTGLEDASLLLEERAHSMRSQPGQFALPGGRVEPEDPDDAAAALREAREETGLDPADVRVLGAFAPIPMPWRDYSVRPVLAHSPQRPRLGPLNPAEVERAVWAPLTGPGSLSHASVRGVGVLDGRATGPAFDLPGDSFVWGFTAMIIAAVLEGLAVPVPPSPPDREVPGHRRRR